MTTLVLHIGSPKTGSSAIQAALPPRPPRWRSAGWCIPPANPYRRSEPAGCIVTLYRPVEKLPRVWRQRHVDNPQKFANDAARFRLLLQHSIRPRLRRAPAAVFLSSEYLWSLSLSSVQQLQSDFSDLGIERFLVIAYVRSPDAFYRSVLQQHARLSSSFKFFRPHRWCYRFRERLEGWRQVFGGDLVVRAFDPNQLVQSCVVHDLAATIQARLPFLPPLAPAPLVRPVNSSASMEELLVMQRWMLQYPAVSTAGGLQRSRALWRHWSRLSRIMGGESGTPLVLRQEVAEQIRERHAADLFWLQDAFGIHFDSLTPAGVAPSVVSREWPKDLRLEDLLEPAQDLALLDRLGKTTIGRLLPTS